MIRAQDKKPGPNDGVMMVSRIAAPSNLNAVRRVSRRGKQAFEAPEAKPYAVVQSTAGAETVARWADKAAVEAKLAKQAERDRKAAYKKLHAPVAGNPACPPARFFM
jgi:hypothetical protein